MKYLIIFLLILIPVFACGPYFAPTILPGIRKFSVIPLADFKSELKNIDHQKKLKNLKDIKKRGKLKEEFIEAAKYYKLEYPELALKDYLEMRQRIEKYRKAKKNNVSDKDVKFPKMKVSNNIPKEYQLYLDGAINYYEGLNSIALKRWEALLNLPKKQRLYRTAWARYMIAEIRKSSMNIGAYLAENKLLREDVAQGFKDIQGLGVSSYGNEGFYFYHQEADYLSAIKRYHLHFIHGGRGALESLKFSIYNFFRSQNDKLSEAVKDPEIRNIITRFLISTYSSSDDSNSRENWLLTLEAEKINDAKLVDRLAWIAYRNGDWKTAERYLKVAEGDSVIKQWLLSRLAFRNAKDELAFKHLKRVAELLKKDSGKRLFETGSQHHLCPSEDFKEFNMGEMALFHLEKGQLKQSLKLFFQSNYWSDAAYLAERLMTADELKLFINENNETLSANKKWFPVLKELLARKLTRQGRWKEAQQYFTVENSKKIQEMFKFLNDGQNLKFSAKERADLLWNAAIIARKWGMTLLATELFPDGYIYGGSFEEGSMGKFRIKYNDMKKIKISDLEKERLKTAPTKPVKRFHYKYTASEIAWRAIKLMPKNDEEAARRLIIAGNWLKAKDPKFADKFYKELVNKCGKTELGKEADKLRWFPELPKKSEP